MFVTSTAGRCWYAGSVGTTGCALGRRLWTRPWVSCAGWVGPWCPLWATHNPSGSLPGGCFEGPHCVSTVRCAPYVPSMTGAVGSSCGGRHRIRFRCACRRRCVEARRSLQMQRQYGSRLVSDRLAAAGEIHKLSGSNDRLKVACLRPLRNQIEIQTI